MKQKHKIMVLIFFFLLSTSPVKADTCDYKTLAELNNKASKITAVYEVNTVGNTQVFDITVHNVIEDLYVTVTPSSKTTTNLEILSISSDMTENGEYTFRVENTTDVIEYKFVVRTTKENCTDDIYTFYLTKPKKNTFYDQDICKYSEVVDYYYCQEWIETEFSITNAEIEEKIISERATKRNKTTKCLSCEAETEAIKEREKQNLIRLFLIMGIVVAIIIDGIAIIFLIRRARRATIWE